MLNHSLVLDTGDISGDGNTREGVCDETTSSSQENTGEEDEEDVGCSLGE